MFVAYADGIAIGNFYKSTTNNATLLQPELYRLFPVPVLLQVQSY